MLASMPRVRLCLVMLFALIALGCTRETLVGTEIDAQPAPDFTLTDGVSGAPLRLASLRGSVVALTFLYTHCPDVCPLTAEYFRQAQERLGSDASKAVFVAVSVDPDHDTPADVQRFSAAHRLDHNWHYLIGPAAALRSVWNAYFVGQRGGDPSGLVGHTDVIYLIDAQGRTRVILHSVDGVDALTKDMRILARE